TIVLITHEMEVIQQICHRIAVMEDGQVVEVGNVYDIFSNPQKPLTKQFVQTVHSLTLPDRLLTGRKGPIIKLLSGVHLLNKALLQRHLSNLMCPLIFYMGKLRTFKISH